MTTINKDKSYIIKPFYKTATALLKMKITTIDDVRAFYIGINNLASEMVSNKPFAKDFKIGKYRDTPKIEESILHILVYGQEIGKVKLLHSNKQSPILKNFNCNAFLKNSLSTEEKLGKIIEGVEPKIKEITENLEYCTKEEVAEIVKKEAENLRKDFHEALKDLQKIKVDTRLIIKDRKGDYYCHDGEEPRLLELTEDALYLHAFAAVYKLRPNGGRISFSDFAGTVTSQRIKTKLKTKKTDKLKCAYIRSLLTANDDGFLGAANLGHSTFHDKPVIKCTSTTGITFNNKK